MRYLKILGLAAVAAAALTAFVGAGTASAKSTELFINTTTTLTGGTTIHATLEPGTTALLQSTSAALTDTCTESTVHGKTTETTVTNGEITGHIETLSFSNCAFTTHVDIPGTLQITNEGSDNGTLTGSNSTVTITVGGAVCLYGTGAGTHLGTLTGAKSATAHATIDINAVINEQEPKKVLCPDTTTWKASYVVTTPTGLNVGE